MKFLLRLLLPFILLGALAGFAVFKYPLEVARLIPSLPSIERLPLNSQASKMLKKGTGELVTPTGSYVKLDNMPLSLRQAVVAIEDERFYQHGGIDFRGIARAALDNLISQNFLEGGSTITQQLARNLFLDPDQTMQRKLTEAFLALQLEDYYHNKNKILELYLNTIYYGRNAWGIASAAKNYFGIDDVSSLNVNQAAFLAGLPQSPSYYGANLTAAKNRQQMVIDKMKELGYLGDNFVNQPLQLKP